MDAFPPPAADSHLDRLSEPTISRTTEEIEREKAALEVEELLKSQIGKRSWRGPPRESDNNGMDMLANIIVERGKQLGRGRYGRIYRCSLLGRMFAMKLVPIGERDVFGRIGALAEAFISLKCNSRYVIRGLGHEIIGNGVKEELRLFLPFYDSSLQEIIQARQEKNKPLTPIEIVSYSLSVAKGIRHLHTNEFTGPICHHDIKSMNVLLNTSDSLKDLDVGICDFGLSEILGHNEKFNAYKGVSNRPGTLRWKAPELGDEGWANLPMADKLKSDIFSFGAVLVELLTLGLPYSHISLPWEVEHAWKKGELPIDSKLYLEENPHMGGIVVLVEQCVQHAVEKRPDAGTVVNRLESLLLNYQYDSDSD